MSNVLSPKTAMNLMQNNDLPPPTKLFAGRDGMFLSSIGKVYDDDHLKMYRDVDKKLEILKALHLSQTRATEAERKLRIVSDNKEALSRLLVDESMVLFAHRQWLTLLELQLIKLERERQEEEEERGRNEGGGSNEGKWCAAMALCLAFAGVGFALGSTFFL